MIGNLIIGQPLIESVANDRKHCKFSWKNPCLVCFLNTEHCLSLTKSRACIQNTAPFLPPKYVFLFFNTFANFQKALILRARGVRKIKAF